MIDRGLLWGTAIGAALGMGANIAFGVFRLHEGTWLCGYLLCLH